jgi:hypothetical protein
MCEGFCGERKHTPEKMCNFSAKYSYAHSHNTVIFIGKLPFVTQTDTFLWFPIQRLIKKVLNIL